jgi:hypothetical protein
MAMCDALEILIALRFAELHDVAAQLTQSHASIRALAQSRPDQWAEHLAQIEMLWDYQGRLPAEFAGFLADQEMSRTLLNFERGALLERHGIEV